MRVHTGSLRLPKVPYADVGLLNTLEKFILLGTD